MSNIRNYQRLALHLLSRALDDICPLEIMDEDTGELIENKLSEQVEKIKDRAQKFTLDEKELDEEWDSIYQKAEDEWNTFLKERKSAFSRIEKTRNRDKVNSKIITHKSNRKLRILRIEKDLIKKKKEYEQKVLKAARKGKPIKEDVIKRKIASLERYSAKRMQSSIKHYENMIKNAEALENTEHVNRRLQESKEIWARREREIKEKYALKVFTFNHKSIEQDQIRLSLYWFIDDIKKVNFWCLLAGVSLEQCYDAVKRRLALLDRTSPEIEDIIQQIKSGKLRPITTGFTKEDLQSREPVWFKI